jgi:hypothetical protein
MKRSNHECILTSLGLLATAKRSVGPLFQKKKTPKFCAMARTRPIYNSTVPGNFPLLHNIVNLTSARLSGLEMQCPQVRTTLPRRDRQELQKTRQQPWL